MPPKGNGSPASLRANLGDVEDGGEEPHRGPARDVLGGHTVAGTATAAGPFRTTFYTDTTRLRRHPDGGVRRDR